MEYKVRYESSYDYTNIDAVFTSDLVLVDDTAILSQLLDEAYGALNISDEPADEFMENLVDDPYYQAGYLIAHFEDDSNIFIWPTSIMDYYDYEKSQGIERG